MSACEEIVVPSGFYAGDKLTKPRRYEMLKTEEDKENTVVVFAAIVGFEFKCGNIVLLEVDEYVAGYVTTIRLCAYGLSRSPYSTDITELTKKMSGADVISITFDSGRVSKTTFNGKHQMGALQVLIRAFISRDDTPLLKQTPLLRSTPQHKQPAFDEDEEELPVRYTSLLHRRSSAISKPPKRMSLKDRLETARARFDNRNFFNRTLDAIAGVQWKDVEKRVGQSVDGEDVQD